MFGYGSNLGCLLACCHDYRSRSSELWQLWCTWGLMFPLHAPQVSWSYCFFSCPQRDGLSSLMFCLSFFTVMLEFLTVSSLSVFGVSSVCLWSSCVIIRVVVLRMFESADDMIEVISKCFTVLGWDWISKCSTVWMNVYNPYYPSNQISSQEKKNCLASLPWFGFRPITRLAYWACCSLVLFRSTCWSKLDSIELAII